MKKEGDERMIRTVLLDADDTLFDFKKSESVALSETLRRFGVEPTERIVARYSEINDGYWKKLERGEILRAELKERRFEDLFGELGVDCDARAVSDCYADLLAQGHFFIDGAEQLLEDLYGRYDLYIVSNGYEKTQRGRLASARAERYFKDVFISQQIGADKPDPAFFAACFSRIPNFCREETVIVGDSLTSDILGGIRAGIKTVWFRHRDAQHPIDGITPDCEIHHLSELLPWLEGQD